MAVANRRCIALEVGCRWYSETLFLLSCLCLILHCTGSSCFVLKHCSLFLKTEGWIKRLLYKADFKGSFTGVQLACQNQCVSWKFSRKYPLRMWLPQQGTDTPLISRSFLVGLREWLSQKSTYLTSISTYVQILNIQVHFCIWYHTPIMPTLEVQRHEGP